MKKWLLLLLAPLSIVTNAQGTYTFQSNVSVPITDSITESTINVETPCSDDFVVMSINVDITFPQTGFLKILINDSALSSYNGGDQADYHNTTFVTLGTPGVQHIATGTPPFTDTFAAELNFDLLSAFPINGPWTLKLVVPQEIAAQGSLNWWSITFGCVGSIPNFVNEISNGHIACYPNPANNLLNIALPKSNVGSTKISFYNMQGKEVLTQNMLEQNATLDVSTLPEGLYTIAGDQYTGHVSVQR